MKAEKQILLVLFVEQENGENKNNLIDGLKCGTTSTVCASEEKQTSTASLARRFLAFFVWWLFLLSIDGDIRAALRCSTVPSSELREKGGPQNSQRVITKPATHR